MNWKKILANLAATGLAAAVLQNQVNGGALTSGNVLIPAAVAILANLTGLLQQPPQKPPAPGPKAQ